MFKTLDAQWQQGPWLNYKDEGPIRPGKPTRKYAVYDQLSGVLVAYIKWDAPWRQYVSWSVPGVRMSAKMHRELDAFLVTVTEQQRAKRKK